MLLSFCCMFFFFKQKTAYEMRISDWSSDVCSSDLFDLDGTTLQILDVINPFKGYTKLRTEEVQLRADFDRVRGVIGYYDEKLNEPYALASQTVQYIAALGGSVPAGGFSESDASTRAGFAEVTFDATDQLSLTAGIRRTRDHRFNKPQTSLLVRGFPAGPILQASGSFRATTWNVSALYKIDPDVSLYATVRRGYRAGGFNPAARSEEQPSELQSLMRISYAVFCLKKNTT